jgi:hypothetical protein
MLQRIGTEDLGRYEAFYFVNATDNAISVAQLGDFNFIIQLPDILTAGFIFDFQVQASAAA